MASGVDIDHVCALASEHREGHFLVVMLAAMLLLHVGVSIALSIVTVYVSTMARPARGDRSERERRTMRLPPLAAINLGRKVVD